MTGVTDLGELVAAQPDLRPTYVAADLGALARRAARPSSRRRTRRRRGVAGARRRGRSGCRSSRWERRRARTPRLVAGWPGDRLAPPRTRHASDDDRDAWCAGAAAAALAAPRRRPAAWPTTSRLTVTEQPCATSNDPEHAGPDDARTNA